jgi:steroid delta-isomerase-like uncharacterized protein
MTHGTAADFARRHVDEIINGRRLDLVDELYAPAAVYNDPVAPGGTARGRDEIKAFFSAIFQAMPDVRFTIEDNFGTADRGLCRGTISATLRGDLGPLPATGKSATAPIAEIVRVADGQIVEAWVYPDTLTIMEQFGLIPASGGA